MLSPLDEDELAAAWRRAAGPDGKVPVDIFYFYILIFISLILSFLSLEQQVTKCICLKLQNVFILNYKWI